MKLATLAGLILSLAMQARAITVNPASAVTGDSDNTPDTEVYRDDSGSFSAQNITVVGSLSVKTVSSSETITGAGGLSVTYGIKAGSITSTGNVAVGSANPANTKLQVSSGTVLVDGSNAKLGVGNASFLPLLPLGVKGTGARAATSGTTPNGVAYFQNSALTAVYTGGDVGSPYALWFQGADTTDLSTVYPLVFNPFGGNVGVGTYGPAAKLHVSSGTFIIDGTGAPTVNQALCLDSTGKLGHCTSVVGAGGGCTCSAP